MKYFSTIYIFSLIIVFYSCNSKGQEELRNKETNVILTNEDFNSFYNKFTKDSIFQKSRVIFPLIVKSYPEEEGDTSIDTVEKGMNIQRILSKEWHYESFYYDSSIAKRELDAYKQTFIIRADSTVLMVRGVDNGIYVDYIFIRNKSLWYLCEVDDYSN